MSGAATRSIAAHGFERIRHDPRIEVVAHSGELSAGAIRLFTARSDKDWSLTDCLSFIVMGRRNIRQALTVDNHFEQAGFQAVLSGGSFRRSTAFMRRPVGPKSNGVLGDHTFSEGPRGLPVRGHIGG